MPPPGIPPPDAGARRRADLLALAIALAFGAWSFLLTTGLDPTARDQVHDLTLAIRVREGTSLTDGNRHPLYPAFLSPWARREPEFFADARIATAVLAAASLFAVHRAASRAFSPAIGLLSLLGVLLEFRLQARRLCPEPLVAGLLALAVSALARAGSSARPLLATGVAGAWTGAAWLAKGSATLSLAAAALHLLFTRGERRLARVAVLVAGFAVAGSPLLAWNLAHGHSPLHNVNSAHVMWEDAWDVELDRRSTATPRAWFERHGVEGAIARLSDGLVHQRGVEWVYGFGTALLVGALLVRVRRARIGAPASLDDAPSAAARAWRSVALWTALLWLLSMAWYAPIVSSRRLLFPIFGVLLPPALDALARGIRGGAPTGSRLATAPRALVLDVVVAVLGLGGALLVAAGNPRGVPSIRPHDVAAARALASLPPGSRVLVRPSRTYPP